MVHELYRIVSMSRADAACALTRWQHLCHHFER